MASEQFPRLTAESARTVSDLVRGCTFDDFLLTPRRSVIERRDPSGIDLSCRVSQRITLKRPIVSANMDTVTRAPMAIVQAERRARRDRSAASPRRHPAAGARGGDRQAHAARRDRRSLQRAPGAPIDEASALMRDRASARWSSSDESGALRGC
jgi:hypothetical protein